MLLAGLILLPFLALLIAGGLWLCARWFLRGASHATFDRPAGGLASSRSTPSPESAEVLRRLRELQGRMRAGRRSLRLATMREAVDDAFATLADPAEGAGCRIEEVDADGVPAEWVLAPGADPSRRLLYLHGGAFVAGSRRSHRAMTIAFSRQAGVAVLAIDYRLLPEHPRAEGIADCRQAYRWLLEHGPDDPSPPTDFYVAGDSAGGNLALMLIAWARDCGLRAVDAAVVFSPLTDSTMASPSMRANIASDPFLGPTLGRLVRLPRWVLAYVTLLGGRLPPQHPAISPLHGQLAGLPPVLVQASTSEMLLDDARRYVNKARSAGSPAELALWPGQIHVWHLFMTVSPEAREALAHAVAFIDRHRHRVGDERA